MDNKCNLCKYIKKGYGENPCAVCSENETIQDRFTEKEPVTDREIWESAKPKEPELFTLQEAINCNIGDRIKNDRFDFTKNENGRFVLTVDENSDVALADELFKLKWKIIPAEPAVFVDANEAWYKSEFGKNWNTEETMCSFKDGFDCGDQNGQLKRDKDYQELREAVENYINDDTTQFYLSGIKEALENLKPLKPE